MRSGLLVTAAASLLVGVSQAQTIKVDGKTVGMSLNPRFPRGCVFCFCRCLALCVSVAGLHAI